MCKRFRFRQMKLYICHHEKLRPYLLFRHVLLYKITTICLHFIWNKEEYHHLHRWKLLCHRVLQPQRCKIFDGSLASNLLLTLLPLQIDAQVLQNQHHLSSFYFWFSRLIFRLIPPPNLSLHLHLISLLLRLLLQLNLFPLHWWYHHRPPKCHPHHQLEWIMWRLSN